MKLFKIIILIGSLFLTGLVAQDKNDSNKNSSAMEKPLKETVVKDEPNLGLPELLKADEVNVYENDNSVRTSVTDITTNRENYRIGFQDVLQITFFKHLELSLVVSVGQDGTIVLPRLDEPIVAVCKTDRELGNLLSKLYTKDFKNPFVTVRSIEQRSQPFAVIGAVTKPGNFFLNQRIKLLSLISLAGGPDVENAGMRVQVARLGNLSACNPTDEADDEIQFLAYDLREVLSGTQNPWMQPGDIVSLLPAEEAYVVGDVNEPTKIVMKNPITLTEAIAQAGGSNDTAKTSKIIIQRKEKNSDVRTELVFDLKEIQARTIADPMLQANDIVVVNSSDYKKVRKGIFDLIKAGVPSIFYRL